MTIEKLYQLFLNCDAVNTDSRAVQKNELFVALKGRNFNGNKYAEAALQNGAKYALIDEEAYFKNETQYILVSDGLETLQQLAAHHRRQFNIPVIGLTGSNGKTTTKELINAVLSIKYKTLATKGNLNNQIGVPLTLLNINKLTEIAIVEMGANYVGEIAELCEITQPNYGLITTIAKAHLEGFGSLEGVRKTKLGLFDYLKNNNGFAFVNADQQEILDGAEQFDFEKKTTYGQSPFVDFLGIPINGTPFAALQYKNETLKSQLFGNYNYINMMAAIAVGSKFDVRANDIKKALANYQPQNKRSQIIKKANNIIVLDAYNANPSSMQAAIEAFVNGYPNQQKILIAGDMFELGKYEAEEHQNIIDLATSLNVNKCFFVGSAFGATTATQSNHSFFKDAEALSTHLTKNKIENACILIKGSRGMQLEQLINLI